MIGTYFIKMSIHIYFDLYNIIFILSDDPVSITITSSGPAARKQDDLMGTYVRDSKVSNLRYVYKKTEKNHYAEGRDREFEIFCKL